MGNTRREERIEKKETRDKKQGRSKTLSLSFHMIGGMGKGAWEESKKEERRVEGKRRRVSESKEMIGHKLLVLTENTVLPPFLFQLRLSVPLSHTLSKCKISVEVGDYTTGVI